LHEGNNMDRRFFLQSMSSAGLMGSLPAFGASGSAPSACSAAEVVASSTLAPRHNIRFAVCGISHDHIYGMVGAILRGGGQLVAAHGSEPDKLATFHKRYPDIQYVADEQQILDDPSIQLVLSSRVPNERAPFGIRVMRHGKDYLSDKPAITTLAQLADVRRAIAETHRIFAIMYSEMLEVPAAVHAGDLVRQGAIGRVIQTINIAPHQVMQHAGDNGGGSPRPDWFWDPQFYGGILCDIGSHQAAQFLYYTGSTSAEVVSSQVANINHPQHPIFQDFGDMVLRGNAGFGYVRLDWFTPDGLGTWGDGRLFILGTEGYIEVRKYANIGLGSHGNNLFLVDSKGVRYMDCSNVTLPFGYQLVNDVVERTHTAQDQEQALLAAELVLRAQQMAQIVHLKT
jgi:predicted dehydrogenase